MVLELVRTFPHAVALGLLVAAACALLGVFVILKRVVFIGAALSELAVCGVALGLATGLPSFASALAMVCVGLAVLARSGVNDRLPPDAVLGALCVAPACLAVLLVAHSGFGLAEVKSLLYGDLILAAPADLRRGALICGIAVVALLVFLRPILYAFMDRDAATVLRLRPAFWEACFFLLLGMVVAAASKTAGALLVFALLLAPAATALLASRRLGVVLALAVVFGMSATMLGLGISFRFDWPTTPTVGAAACAQLLAVWVAGAVARRVVALRGRAGTMPP